MIEPVTIVDPVLLIRVPSAYREGMSDMAVCEATQGAWRR
jgi:hypothetical protein